MAKKADEKDDEVTVSIRFPPELHAALKDAADADERSLNSYVVRALRTHVEAARTQAERKGGR